MKRILHFLLALVMVLSLLPATALAATRTTEPAAALLTGSAVTTGWVQQDGKWYYYNPDGTMRLGWLQYGTNHVWYYFDEDGAMATGWRHVSSKWYYFDAEGVMMTGWVHVDGEWYFLDKTSGALQAGWILDGGKWYYCNGSGVMYSDEAVVISGKTYYFDASGAMVTGWLLTTDENGDDGWVFFDRTNGDMKTGWIKDGGKWYYCDPFMYCDGIYDIGEKTYCFGPDGDMQTGWIQAEAETGEQGWLFFDKTNGDMRTGWILDGGKWYYCNDLMYCDDIYDIDGSYYYFGPNGDMKTGWVKITYDGQVYWFYFNPNGDMHFGWLKDGGKWYYCDGPICTDGDYQIDGKIYHFDKNGVCTNP